MVYECYDFTRNPIVEDRTFLLASDGMPIETAPDHVGLPRLAVGHQTNKSF